LHKCTRIQKNEFRAIAESSISIVYCVSKVDTKILVTRNKYKKNNLISFVYSELPVTGSSLHYITSAAKTLESPVFHFAISK